MKLSRQIMFGTWPQLNRSNRDRQRAE